MIMSYFWKLESIGFFKCNKNTSPRRGKQKTDGQDQNIRKTNKNLVGRSLYPGRQTDGPFRDE